MQTIKLHGIRELVTEMAALGKIHVPKATRGMTRAICKVFVQAAREKVPKRSGALKKSIGIITQQTRQGPTYYVTPRRRVGKKTYSSRHAHLVEFGTAPHEIIAGRTKKRKTPQQPSVLAGELEHPVKRVEHPGAKPHPFMRPAFDENVERAINAGVEYMRRRLMHIKQQVMADES